MTAMIDANGLVVWLVMAGRFVIVSLAMGIPMAAVTPALRWVRWRKPALAHRCALLALASLMIVPVSLAGLPRQRVGEASPPVLQASPAEDQNSIPATGAAHSPLGAVARSGTGRRGMARILERAPLWVLAGLHRLWWSHVLAVVGLAWFAGMIISLVRLARFAVRVHKAVAEGEPLPGGIAASLPGHSGARHPLPVVVSSWWGGPALVGFVRPVMVVPLSFAAWPPDVVRAVVAHEHAHAQRLDGLWAALESLLVALVFFHPVARSLAGAADDAREDAADDLAVEWSALGPRAYVRGLAELAAAPAVRGVPAARRGRLEWRAERLLSAGGRAPRTGLVGALVALAVVTLPIGPTVAFANACAWSALPVRTVWATTTQGMAFTPGFGGIAGLSTLPGGRPEEVSLVEHVAGRSRSVRVTPGPEYGQLRYEYRVDGRPAAFDAAARAWYDSVLEAAVLRPMRAFYAREHNAGMWPAWTYGEGATLYSLLQVDRRSGQVAPQAIAVLDRMRAWFVAPDRTPYPPLGAQAVEESLLQLQHALRTRAVSQAAARERLVAAIRANPTASEPVQLELIRTIAAFSNPDDVLDMLRATMNADVLGDASQRLVRQVVLDVVPASPKREAFLRSLSVTR